ncbi:MAG: hypothetical protein IMX02_07550 [Limnochordaceae bacterium]|nr:hypothetical protein [Limnochordaceae bacterium]
MKAAQVQRSSAVDRGHNLEDAVRWVRSAAAVGGELIVLPEMLMGMPSSDQPL